MKNILKLIPMVVFMVFVGCNGDEQPIIDNNENPGNNIDNPGDGPEPTFGHISLEEVKALLPEALTQGTAVVYKDEEGNETKLETVFMEFQKERTEYGRTYTLDDFLVRLFSEQHTDLIIDINGVGLYTQAGEVHKAIDVLLVPWNPGGLTSSIIILVENGEPEVSGFDDFKESIELHGREFKDVYLSFKESVIIIGPTPGSYSEVYMNFTEGIVAFRDGEDKLWVFDRFE